MLKKPIKGMALREVSKKYYGPACSSGSRPLSAVKYVVIHDTEGDTAAGGAAYLKNRPDGSVHMVVDDISAYWCAPDSLICCGTGGFNTSTWHIEQPGRAAWSAKLWLRHQSQLRRVAWHVAKKLRDFKLPCAFRTAADLRAGRGGYTTHAEVTKSGLGTTTHLDPGNGYPFTGKWSEKLLIRYYYHKFGRRAPSYKVRG